MLSGGRARPMTSLPVAVMASEPAAAITMSTNGVHERHRHHHRHDDGDNEDRHPHGATDVGVERDWRGRARAAPRDGRSQHGLVEACDAVGLDDRVVDLGRAAANVRPTDEGASRVRRCTTSTHRAPSSGQPRRRRAPGVGRGRSGQLGQVAGPDPLLGRGVVAHASRHPRKAEPAPYRRAMQRRPRRPRQDRREQTPKGPVANDRASRLTAWCEHRVVEVAGIEPASIDGKPGLLRVQCAVDFLGPSARTHTSADRPSRVRVPRSPPT